MRKSIVAGAAITASLALAGTAQANSITTTFDDFHMGTVDGQDGWTVGSKYDTEVTSGDQGQALRVSNAVTDGSFADMLYSTPVDPAGEDVDNNVLVNEFTIKSVTGKVQPGLSMSVAPTGEGGSRMSYLRFEDRFDGIRVFFNDATFTDKWVATLSRDEAHAVKFVTTFVPGNDNDVVRVSIDGEQEVCGTSWENYYRFGEQHAPSVTDRMMWRLGGTAAPANAGNGYLFDDVTSDSYTNEDTVDPCVTQPADGQDGEDGTDGEDGQDGTNGTDGKDGTNGTNGTDGKNGSNGSNGSNGVNGKDGAAGSAGKDGVNGVTTIIREYGKVSGARMRTVYAPKSKGKFVAVRAKLRGKSLPTSGRSIKVDLRGKSVGNYIVRMVAKYKKGGKTYKVRGIRSLNIVRK